MIRDCWTGLVGAVLAIVGFATVVQAQPSGTSADLASRAVERRAIEAMNWGMAAVNTDLMLQEMLNKTTGKMNQIVYWSRPLDWRNQTLTPNPDAIYLMAFFNTKDAGPIVLEIPAAGEDGSLNGNIVDFWQVPLEDAGPSGADAGKGGKYLVLPPGYTGSVPVGYIALRSTTYGGYALLRSNLKSHSEADIARSVAYGKKVKLYPLSQAASPPHTVFADAADVLFDSTIRYDASFFTSLDRVVQSEPWLSRDRAMIDVLRTLGIEKGKTFNPDAKTKAALETGAREAQAWLEARYDTGLPPFYPGSHWNSLASPEMIAAVQSDFDDPDKYPVDARGMTYTYAFVGLKRLGTGQFYLVSLRDKDGNPFDGGKTYRMTVPANPPVEQYWSLTAYDRQRHTLIRNMPRASRSSQIPEMQKNADGSVDVYLGPAAPAGKEPNWIPTDPQRAFEVMFRAYAPTKAFFDKTWKLPDIEKVAAQ
ncbi:hypothetical protein BB934_32905 (plasmid) [Microvirga ossetica]|uniref:DUF1254 domain-containing protein n=1 Tax=Microvirga ossetica TaxID=1882682 RepID=A0A1B2ESR0_9HYPH|nr:DUF1254 domain-containing protein [Microvirga ossetica]ANY83014.1 hypothetical protein BB934_32905 [Microvirga ossetica]